jgi:hypothetical protein
MLFRGKGGDESGIGIFGIAAIVPPISAEL